MTRFYICLCALLAVVWAAPLDPFLETDAQFALPARPELLDAPQRVSRLSGGHKRVLVLMVDFPNHPGTYQPCQLESLLFGPGGMSFADYYREVSYGALVLSGTVSGWLRMPEPDSYYIARKCGIGTHYPHNTQRLAEDAIRAADPYIDFSQYDNDRDGHIDYLCLVHAGLGFEQTEDSTDFWSHKWQLTGTGTGCPGACRTQDGVSLDAYSFEPEESWPGALSTIGVFAHEFGHLLGLPDLYDTDYSSEGIGMFCLMGSGMWGASWKGEDGSCPVHICAWGKSLLGWMSPHVLEHDSSVDGVHVELPATCFLPEAWRVLGNPGGVDWQVDGKGHGEYFMVENRLAYGFDEALPGSGLLITHIDESRKNNDDEHNPLVGLAQADHSADYALPAGDRGRSEDLWRYDSTGFTPSTMPASKLYSGEQTGVVVRAIGGADSSMTAVLAIEPPLISKVATRPSPLLVSHEPGRVIISWVPPNPERLRNRFPPFTVGVFDMLGKKVKTLGRIPDEIDPIQRSAYWNVKDQSGRDVSSGLYLCLLHLGDGYDEKATAKVVVIR